MKLIFSLFLTFYDLNQLKLDALLSFHNIERIFLASSLHIFYFDLIFLILENKYEFVF
jgi:hypothetical protein